MSRRSSRAKPQATATALAPSVKRGLASLINNNEGAISSMLDSSPSADLLAELVGVMAVNGLSAEGLLAQWFSQQLLATCAPPHPSRRRPPPMP